MRFQRISIDPALMGGQPCIRGLRIPVATVVAMVADGMTVEAILREHPDLEASDVAEALRYAADAEVELRVVADRDRFVLSPGAQRHWDELNRRPARDLRGLRELVERPSPFASS